MKHMMLGSHDSRKDHIKSEISVAKAEFSFAKRRQGKFGANWEGLYIAAMINTLRMYWLQDLFGKDLAHLEPWALEEIHQKWIPDFIYVVVAYTYVSFKKLMKCYFCLALHLQTFPICD